MDKIRLSNYTKKIEVNDNGDYITINVADMSIPKKIKELAVEAQGYSEKIDTLMLEFKDSNSADAQLKVQDFIYEMSVAVNKKIDDIFGADTCKKVFGDIVAPIDLCYEFLEAITPLFAEYAKDRAKKMTKYSPDREGSSHISAL